MNKVLMIAVTASIGMTFASHGMSAMEELELACIHDFIPKDNYTDAELNQPDVPLRSKNALAEFQDFISRHGWTTNQLVESLMFIMTNNMTEANWADADKRRAAGVAAWQLSEINLPAVTNFFRQCNCVNTTRLKRYTILGMFPYTNLEPEVLDYMRTLCVRTNVYDRIAPNVMLNMFETLETMPPELKPAATNRVARYMYFAIHHVTDSQGWQDLELSNFIPSYSNSIQRLSLMQYVSTSATNAWERSNAAAIVQALSAIPTNQLNDISWIAE